MVDKIVEILKSWGRFWNYSFPDVEIDDLTDRLAQLYSAKCPVCPSEDVIRTSEADDYYCEVCGHEWVYSAGEEFSPVDLTDVEPDKLTRPTVTEEEIEQAWKSWMCTLDNLAKDEQVMLEGDFYAAIKELIDK